MSLLSNTRLRSKLLALGTFAAVSALSAAPALADHPHGGGVWFPPVPQIFVPFPPFVVVAGPHGHGCGYHEDYYYDDDHSHHYHYYDRGYRYGYRGAYRGDWRNYVRGHGHGHQGRGHGRGHKGHGH